MKIIIVIKKKTEFKIKREFEEFEYEFVKDKNSNRMLY